MTEQPLTMLIGDNHNQPADLAKLVERSASEKQPKKIERILQALTDPKGLNRFEAEVIGCHCLNSTISALKNRHGVLVSSEWEKVPNRFGGDAVCKRYWISTSNLERANKLLERWAKARGANTQDHNQKS